jgi:hypothetical protein
VIWDLICIAWVLNPAWVPSELVRTPVLTADKRWQAQPGSATGCARPMRVERDAIFNAVFAALAALNRLARAPRTRRPGLKVFPETSSSLMLLLSSLPARVWSGLQSVSIHTEGDPHEEGTWSGRAGARAGHHHGL